MKMKIVTLLAVACSLCYAQPAEKQRDRLHLVFSSAVGDIASFKRGYNLHEQNPDRGRVEDLLERWPDLLFFQDRKGGFIIVSKGPSFQLEKGGVKCRILDVGGKRWVVAEEALWGIVAEISRAKGGEFEKVSKKLFALHAVEKTTIVNELIAQHF